MNKKLHIGLAAVAILVVAVLPLLIYKFSNGVVNDLDSKRSEARDQARITALKIIALDAELYNDSGSYPVTTTTIRLIPGSTDYQWLQKEFNKIKDTTSDNVIPVDPLNDPQRAYTYAGNKNSFHVTAYLENQIDGCKMIKPGYCEFTYTTNTASNK